MIITYDQGIGKIVMLSLIEAQFKTNYNQVIENLNEIHLPQLDKQMDNTNAWSHRIIQSKTKIREQNFIREDNHVHKMSK